MNIVNKIMEQVRGPRDGEENVLITKGYCPICEGASRFRATHTWYRDYYLCEKCGTCPRQRAMAVILTQLLPNWRKLSMHEGSPCIPYFGEQCKNYSCSYYFADVPPGACQPGTDRRCENFEALTYEDNTFDIFMHMDVLEHVFNPGASVREAMRVLKPGGLHIFTVPKNKRLLKSEPRATLEDGAVNHLKDVQYHGDPKDEAGVLVTWDYGADFEDLMSARSGYLISTFILRDRRYGLDGDYLEVFFSWKTKENALDEVERERLCEKCRAIAP